MSLPREPARRWSRLRRRRLRSASPRYGRRSVPLLPARLFAAPVDDVRGQVRILVRTVGAEVGAAALLSRESAVGDQARQQVLRAPEPPEAGAVADEAGVLPQSSTDCARDREFRLELWWISGRGSGLVECG